MKEYVVEVEMKAYAEIRVFAESAEEAEMRPGIWQLRMMLMIGKFMM